MLALIGTCDDSSLGKAFSHGAVVLTGVSWRLDGRLGGGCGTGKGVKDDHTHAKKKNQR